MKGLLRRLFDERRERTRRRTSPSEAFKRYFGPEHGVDLPPRSRYGYRPVELDENEA